MSKPAEIVEELPKMNPKTVGLYGAAAVVTAVSAFFIVKRLRAPKVSFKDIEFTDN